MREIIPRERNKTIRQEITRLLDGNRLSVTVLSKEIRLSERELYSHLEQIKRSGLLLIIPAACDDCGFVFADRNRVKKPGKCPKCKSTHIEPPLFSIRTR
jgi:transcriptional regulator